MILRPYQETIAEQTRAELRLGHDPVIVSPCGSGKGSLLSFMVNGAVSRGHKVIFAVHGKALVVDMSERISKLGITHGVLMGGETRKRWHDVQVASIDTLHRMAHPPEASLIIADEADGAMSPTWRKTLARYPNARLIGATATPIRTDGKGLGKATGGLFDSIVLGPCEQELIDMGYLVGSRVLAPPPPADLGNLKKTAGEFNAKQQAEICDKAKIIGDIVEHWKKHAVPGKTAAFGVDKAHAAHIAERFNNAGVPFAYVDDQTSQQDRAQIWRDLDREDGTLMGVSSCGVTLVGWDHAIVSNLVIARKTASLRLHKQILGRGSRPFKGKTHFLVLDHVGNVHYHEPFGLFEQTPEWSLEGAAIRETDDKKPPTVVTCKHAYKWPDFRNEPPRIINGLQLPCYATFKAGARECPFCGMPLKIMARKIEQVAGELQEIKARVRVESASMRECREYYESLLAQADQRGKNAGWASFCFQKKMGAWPEKHWRSDWISRQLSKEMASV